VVTTTGSKVYPYQKIIVSVGTGTAGANGQVTVTW
jgi:hypothetical protein